uniref:Putative portal protein n=1 Tax=viral metagenome TaxID=1070528 RepID=A0A6M3IUN5_9ZZZZ
MAHLLTWGNCYAEKVYNKLGDIVELWPIAPNRITPDRIENGTIIYRIMVDGKTIYLGRDRILHIPGLGFDGFQGYSVIAMARKSLGLAMAMETFGSKYFGDGTHPSGIITHPLAIKNDNLRKALTESYAGLGKSHRLMLLEEGMDYKSVGIPPEDSQFLESRQFQIPEVARWFNLPPHKLKDLSKSSFSNIESEQISFVTDSILPWLIRLEQNYALQLLSILDVKQEFFFRHNVDGLLRGNAKDRSEYYRTMFNIGAMSINDIREKENWDPVDGGDERFVPLNMIPLSRLDEYLDRQVTKNTTTNKEPDNANQQP